MLEWVRASAPSRVDLAGGTLDIPPLHHLHAPSCTVNVAVSLRAQALARRRRDGKLVFLDRNAGRKRRWSSYEDLARDASSSDLPAGLLLEFRVPGGVSVDVSTRVPRGSGLGGSSCLGMALGAALSRLGGARIAREELIERVKSVETRVIACPTGYQDYYAAAFGGVSVIDFLTGGPRRSSAGSPAFLRELEDRLLLVYSGVQHFSGTNNWELFRRRMEGEGRMRRFFDALAENSRRMRRAVLACDLRRVALEMSRDWETRRAMITGMSTPAIDRFLASARRLGARPAERPDTLPGNWGRRVCGAGGGGCVALLVPGGAREAVRGAASRLGMTPLEARVERRGLLVRAG